jgi:hypothetical protein
MTTVNVTKTIQVPATTVWARLATFRGIEEYSPIARSVTSGEGVGATRTCYMPDDAAISEELVALDHDSMHFQYKILSGPFPVEGYLSTVVVKSIDSQSCEVSWGSQFETAQEAEGQMIELFDGFYNVIIDSLGTMLASNN